MGNSKAHLVLLSVSDILSLKQRWLKIWNNQQNTMERSWDFMNRDRSFDLSEKRSFSS